MCNEISLSEHQGCVKNEIFVEKETGDVIITISAHGLAQIILKADGDVIFDGKKLCCSSSRFCLERVDDPVGR
jgi:hypothetical protein